MDSNAALNLPDEEPSPPVSSTPLIAIVGPCASGKSTLAAALQARGFQARQISQEHSYVPDMWQVITKPDILLYLDASFENCTHRKNLNWLLAEYEEQKHRLEHARSHCDIFLPTDGETPDSVLESALDALKGLLNAHE